MKTLMVLLMMLAFVPASFATPPGDINLSYDLVTAGLTAQGPHPTQDLTEHFIRRIEVVINGQEKKIFYFPRQVSPSKFEESMALELKPGDEIHVTVFCSQGGSKEADLKIADLPSEKIAPVNLKVIKDNDHQSMPIIP